MQGGDRGEGHPSHRCRANSGIIWLWAVVLVTAVGFPRIPEGTRHFMLDMNQLWRYRF